MRFAPKRRMRQTPHTPRNSARPFGAPITKLRQKQFGAHSAQFSARTKEIT